jgi:hypothetical protein
MLCVLVLDKPLVSPLRASGHQRLVLSKIKALVVAPGGLVSVGIGAKLRTIRQQWQLSLREVEERSLRFAQEQGDQSYQVSASWLVRLEREDHELTVNKLHDRPCIRVAIVHDRAGEHPRVDHLAEPGHLAEAVPGQLLLSLAPASNLALLRTRRKGE